MILTVCLSPCTDVTVEVDSLNLGKLNIARSKQLTFTGKALNVAIGVSRLGGDSFATGFMYNENGYMFEQALDKEGVPFTFVWNKGRVRENYKFIDNKYMLTEVNEVGEPVSEEKQKELVQLVSSLAEKSNIVVVSGGLPRGVNPGYYADVLNAIPAGKIKIADAEGPKLQAALNAGVDLVKPNLDELQSFLGREFKTKNDLLDGCYELLNRGTKTVLLSLGKEGGIITDGHKSYYSKSINVAINSTVGAGDAMLSAAALMMERGADIKTMLKAGVAAGTARVTTFGRVSFAKEKYDDLYDNIVVTEL